MIRRLFSALAIALVLGLHATPGSSEEEPIVLHLKNGNAMGCQWVSETPSSVTVRWEKSLLTFQKSEIARIEKTKIAKDNKIILANSNTASTKAYHNNPALRLTDGKVLDARILSMDQNSLRLQTDLGEGDSAEIVLPRSRLQELIFSPLQNAESQALRGTLQKQFPKYTFAELGLITLITNTEGSSLKLIKQTLLDQQNALFFEFFDLLRDHQPRLQHFVVVFDSLADYYEFAASQGIPPALCPGFFSPREKTLYLINFFGDEISRMVQEVVLEGRREIRSQEAKIQSQVGAQHSTAISGMAKDFTMRFEDANTYIMGIMMEQTLLVLRHEFTHEFFHHWGLQAVEISRLQKGADILNKGKEHLKAQNREQKISLILEILGQEKESLGSLELQAANSWFVEGLAEYASTSAIGHENKERLFELKQNKASGSLWPIEQLTVYKMGSFRGVTTEAALSAYAQSWSFVEFLMKFYRAPFLKYLGKMASHRAGENEDIEWLLETLGKDSKTLEKEWHAYIDTLPEAEDPYLERLMAVKKIFSQR